MIFKNVALGLSGGVDSAVSAYLLKKKGFNVIGVFMKNWDERDETGYCTSENDYADAQKISRHLKIPLRQFNYVKEYWSDVFSNFIKDYEEGLTPNPDILCNRNIKFNMFFKHAIENLGCDAIATGHYACSSFGAFLETYEKNADVRLLQSTDTFKDQTFFLSQVPQSTLRRCMFPIGTMNKHEVKQIARDIGLGQIAKKKESIGICFVGDRNFPKFIEEYIDPRPGKFIDIDSGKVVGEHKGVHYWTLGQRCNLSGYLNAYFVCRKDAENSIIYVASGTNHPFMHSHIFYTNEPYWIRDSPLNDRTFITCEFRFQHTKPLTDCIVYKANTEGSRLLVMLSKPLRSITPGQYAVFYKDKECLGSSRIFNFLPSIKTLKSE